MATVNGRTLLGLMMSLALVGTGQPPAWAGHNFLGTHAHTRQPNEVWVGMNMAARAGQVEAAINRWSSSASPYHALRYMGIGTSAATIKPGHIDWANLGCGAGDCPCGVNFSFNDGHASIYNITYMNADLPGWYLGSGIPAPDQLDFSSCVTHELGHWIRLGDLYSPDPGCANPVDLATMCGLLPRGATQQRTPNSEDASSAAFERELCKFEQGVCSPVPTRRSP